MSVRISISEDEQKLFDKVKRVIARNPGVRQKGYEAILDACKSSGMFSTKELSLLDPVFKDSLSKRILNKILELFNN